MSLLSSAIYNLENRVKALKASGASENEIIARISSEDFFRGFPLQLSSVIHVIFTVSADASVDDILDYIAFTASSPTPTPTPTPAPPTPAPTFMPTLGSCAPISNVTQLTFPSQISADDIGSNIASGIRIVGGNSAGAGSSIVVGDIDNDGRKDIIIGAPDANKVYVVLGSTLTGPSLNVASIETEVMPGIVIQFEDSGRRSEERHSLGRSVASGDINQDGFADIAFSSSEGACVVFGGEDLPQIIDFDDIVSSGLGVCTDLGPRAHIAFTDFNWDGYDDLIVPAGGQINIFLGGPSLSNTTNLSNLQLRISLSATGHSYEWASAVGDLNGDQNQDLLVTLQPDESEISYACYAYIVFGIENVTAPSTLELFDIGMDADTAGVLINGSAISSFVPTNPSKNSGDFNHDGHNDIAITNLNNLDILIIHGPFDSDHNNIDISAIGTFDNGQGVLFSGNDLTSRRDIAALRNAGSIFQDLNNDNIADFIIGYTEQINLSPQPGMAYIVFGHDHPDAEISLLNSTLITLIEGSHVGFGSSLASCDVNCDGIPELLVGAPFGSDTFGRRAGGGPTPAPTAPPDDNVFIFFG